MSALAVEQTTAGHWLTFTTPRDVRATLEVLGGGHGATENTWAYGHKSVITHESGTRVYFGSNRPDQPTVVNMSGEVCEGFWAEGLAWAEQLEGRVTRVDVAKDVGPADLARSRLIEMETAWKRGRVVTKMRPGSHSLIKSDRPGEGWTAYYGGRQSDLKLRAYDRRGPLRLEWQWGPARDLGTFVPGMFRRRGCEPIWRDLTQAAIWPMPWFQKLLEGGGQRPAASLEDETRFAQAIAAVRQQLGATLWAFQLAGVSLGDVAVDPGDELRGDLAAKFLGWAKDAPEVGYDGEALREAVRCRLKQKPVRA